MYHNADHQPQRIQNRVIMTHTSELSIVSEYLPGSIGRIADLHGTYYHEYWGFGLFFEAKVATELSAFLKRFDEKCDGIWLATANGRVEGSLIIDGIEAENIGARRLHTVMTTLLEDILFEPPKDKKKINPIKITVCTIYLTIISSVGCNLRLSDAKTPGPLGLDRC